MREEEAPILSITIYPHFYHSYHQRVSARLSGGGGVVRASLDLYLGTKGQGREGVSGSVQRSIIGDLLKSFVRFETDCWVGSMVSSRQLVWLTVSSLRYVLRGGGRGQKFDYRWQGCGRIRVIIISHKGRQG